MKLTVKEYASMHGVTPAAVGQWIKYKGLKHAKDRHGRYEILSSTKPPVTIRTAYDARVSAAQSAMVKIKNMTGIFSAEEMNVIIKQLRKV